jgi:hypothetical protein
MFQVSAADLDRLRIHSSQNNLVWSINASQVHRGLPLYGSSLSFDVTKTGELSWIRARLYPDVLLEGFNTQPRLSEEEAIASAAAAQERTVGFRPAQLVIGFRWENQEPFLMWVVRLMVSRPLIPNSPTEWLYLVDDTSGEVLLFAELVSDAGGPLKRAFVRGDANADAHFDLADPVLALFHLFLGRPAALVCPDAADSNDDGIVGLPDVIYSLHHLFLDGPSPPAPYPGAGPDLTEDEFECVLESGS